ncbi:MAG TPA: hypothetical protein VF509_11820 [Sphingobium sp.]
MMMCDNVVRLSPGQGAPESSAAAEQAGGNAAVEPHALALRMHRFSLARDAQFQADVLRNPEWDIMLSLYIARLEELDAPFASLCAANRLSTDICSAALQSLLSLSFVQWDGGRGNVVLTERGHAQMNQFLQRVALSA